jgi:predicted acylesterase/phospholipase RssA
VAHRIPTAKKVALVLCGGGGKGAYQIGCWKALREAGIAQFALISGVSVGALNAALIGMNDFELAKKLWSELSPDHVLFNPGGERRVTLFKAATALSAAVTFPFPLGWRSRLRDAALFVSTFGYIGSNRPLSNLIRRYVSGEKLRRTGAKVFVAHSIEDCYFDPYEPFYNQPEAHEAPGFVQTEPDRDYVPVAEWDWLPHVTEITSLLSDSEIRKALLRSALLPPVFKQSRLNDRRITDGGVANNVPIYPAVAEGCDLIFVLYLNHRANPTLNEIQSMLAKQYFQCEVGKRLSRTDARDLYRGFCETGFPPHPRPPFSVSGQQIKFVVPSRPLGETFDFTGGSRTQDLIEQGEKDMKAVLP